MTNERPQPGVLLKHLTRKPTFGLEHPVLRVFLPWQVTVRNSRV